MKHPDPVGFDLKIDEKKMRITITLSATTEDVFELMVAVIGNAMRGGSVIMGSHFNNFLIRVKP